MFEDLIVSLDDLGVTYTENADDGTLTIDIADIDKSVLVSVINALMSNSITDYTIDDTSIVVSGYMSTEEGGEEDYEEDYDAQAQALDEMTAGLGGGSY
jgi:hypothetical protein